MKITVAQAIVRCLELEQIEYAFGLTGSHLLAFFKALKDSSIRYISVKHEGAAGFMALNYTKIVQKPALLIATAGPGAANLINGVAEMYKCGIPGFILTPVVPINTFGKNALQEDSGYGLSYSVNRLLGAVTKKSVLAINGEMVPSLIRDLFRQAFTPPYGPVHISVPVNLFTEEIEFEELHPGQYRAINDCRVEHQKIRKAVGYISEAKKPLLLIGNRCLFPDCSGPLKDLIVSSGIPFVLTHASKGILDENHGLFGGILDYFGHRSAEKYTKESDCIIAFGMDFSEAETIKYDPELFKNAKLLAFDSSELQIGGNFPIEMGIVGNLPETIRELQKALTETGFKSPWSPEEFGKSFQAYNEYQFKEMNLVSNPLPIAFIYRELSKLLNDSVVFVDQSAVGFSSVRHFITTEKGYYTSPTGYSMAQSVAGVIGGKIACGNKNVFCISGDGAFLMHGNEVLTAVQYKLGITWIIFVENLYNMVHINQCLAYGGELGFCTHVQNPDFEHLAKAFGVSYFRVTDKSNLNHSIIKAKEINLKNECTLIEVRYNHEQHLPIKPQLIQTMKDFGHTKDIKSNPYLMKAFTKTLKEKV